MCKPSPVLLENPVVGFVPYRPLGQSHFQEAPWADPNRPSDDYLPSAMTLDALKKAKKWSMAPLYSYSERQVNYVYGQLCEIFGPMMEGDNFLPIEELRHRISWNKSPGYPYYFNTFTNSQAMAVYGAEIHEKYYTMLSGGELWMPFSVTLKDELRTKEKVADESTRAFDATSLPFNMLCKSMFALQNDRIMEHVGAHPVTLGVSLPGPQFVNLTLSLGVNPPELQPETNGGDGKHWDQTCNLSLTRAVRDFRKRFQAPHFSSLIDYIYDTVYAGDRIACGVVYKVLHQCSGWENTGTDNSLVLLGALIDAFHELTGLDWKEYFKVHTNGDDFRHRIVGKVKCKDGALLSAARIKTYLAQYGIEVEYESETPVLCYQATYLSHHLRSRWVSGIGEIMVAAGNLSKLQASINWVPVSSNVSFEESCVMHLLGLRICLWPWPVEFAGIEEKLNNYLQSLKKDNLLSMTILDLLRARIPETAIIAIHTKLEEADQLDPILTRCLTFLSRSGFTFFSNFGYHVALNYQHDNYGLQSYAMQKLPAHANTKKSNDAVRRAAQSARDKARAKMLKAVSTTVVKANLQPKRSSAGRAVSITGNASRKMAAPAAVSSENRFSFEVKRGRYKDSVRITAKEWLGTIRTGSGTKVGQTLLEFYLNPSEFGGGRLALFAQLYEKFLFRKFNVHFAPTVGTSTSGSIILAYDRDINDPTPSSNEQGVRSFLAFEDSISGNVWSPKTMACKLESPETGFYTNTSNSQDDRLVYQGQIYVAVMEPPPDNTVLGDLIFEYDCELFVPQLENSPVGVYLSTVTGGSLGPTQSPTDYLYNLQNNFAGSLNAVNAGNLKPKVDGDGQYYIDLAEGLWRIVSRMNGTSASPKTVAAPLPTVVLNQPQQAPAPQVITSTYLADNYNSSSANNKWTSDVDLAIPRGGGKVYMVGANLDNILNTGGSSGAVFNIIRKGAYVDPASQYPA